MDHYKKAADRMVDLAIDQFEKYLDSHSQNQGIAINKEHPMVRSFTAFVCKEFATQLPELANSLDTPAGKLLIENLEQVAAPAKNAMSGMFKLVDK